APVGAVRRPLPALPRRRVGPRHAVSPSPARTAARTGVARRGRVPPRVRLGARRPRPGDPVCDRPAAARPRPRRPTAPPERHARRLAAARRGAEAAAGEGGSLLRDEPADGGGAGTRRLTTGDGDRGDRL